MRFLVSSPAVDSCTESLAGLYLRHLEYYKSIGELQISRIFTVQDLVFLSQRYAAFQGETIILLAHCSRDFSAVSLLLPKAKFKNDYLKSTNTETMILTDQFYSILRTMYRWESSVCPVLCIPSHNHFLSIFTFQIV